MMTKEMDLVRPQKKPERWQLRPSGCSAILHFCRDFSTVFVFAILPSYFADWIQKMPQPSSKRLPTAYLNGLRGLFSFLVFVRHFLLPWVKDLDTGYNQTDSPKFLKLPIIRVVYSGPTVAIFFVVSGFVISSKPLRLIRGKDFAAMSTAMISSVFRRGLRLFLPPIISTFSVALFVHIGWYKTAYDEMPGDIPRHPARYGLLVDQLGDWLRFVLADLTHPWSWKSPRSEYDSHLWTIPIQFRASMISFLALLGLAKAKPKARTGCLLALTAYSLQQEKWPVALFLAGIMMAEWNLVEMESHIHQSLAAVDPASCLPRYQSIVSQPATCTVLYRACFILGLYLGSYPRAQYAGHSSLGFMWLSKITDDDRYWQAYGAILLLWSFSKDPVLQKLLTGSVLQYLGNISFSLYLVHGPVLHLFGYSLVPYMWEWTGSDTATKSQLGIGLSLITLAPIMLWIADVFWRLVDKPCGVLVARIESVEATGLSRYDETCSRDDGDEPRSYLDSTSYELHMKESMIKGFGLIDLDPPLLSSSPGRDLSYTRISAVLYRLSQWIS
ncbi:hypothetical protein DL98DRAFT_575997 [Cadophora sp. DSE1049]|nr:hypothetical protein DL98DRAFT_575997 [Cadophora sp. DSE1049]